MAGTSAARQCVAALLLSFAVVARGAGVRAAGRAAEQPPPENDCPMSRSLTEPRPANLVLCSQYAASSCCTEDEDAELHHDFRSMYSVLYDRGCPGCLNALRDLYCGLYCAPTQSDFLVVTSATPEGRLVSGEMRVYSHFCSRFFDACKTIYPANTMEGRFAAFCKSALDTNTNVTVSVVEDFDDVFMTYTSNHCDGKVTGAPMRLDSTISLGWILMLGGVGLVTVGIMVLIIYWLNRKPQYQPVPPPEPEPLKVAYRVVGAGVAAANGNFYPAGHKNDAEVYRNEHNVIMSRERLRGSEERGWVIGQHGVALYGVRTTLPAPPRHGWSVYRKKGAPAPTVVLVEQE